MSKKYEGIKLLSWYKKSKRHGGISTSIFNIKEELLQRFPYARKFALMRILSLHFNALYLILFLYEKRKSNEFFFAAALKQKKAKEKKIMSFIKVFH